MTILMIAHERNMGGASKSLVTLACELSEKGAKVHVVLPYKKGGVSDALAAHPEISVKYIFFGWWMQPMYWNGLFKLGFRFLHFLECFAVSAICRYARRIGADVIHSNSSVIDVGARAAEKLGLNHVWHVREFGEPDYRLEFMLGRERSLSYMSRAKGVVVFISKALRDYYHELPDEICRVIYNGISEDYLYEKEMAKPSKNAEFSSGMNPNVDLQEDRKRPFTFLIAANLQRTKRQDIAILAAGELAREGITNWKLVIAGGAADTADSRSYEAELKKLAEGLEDQIEFTGSVKDMKPLRIGSDAELVLSSREAFGRVTVEAMMASNPVIATNAGANPELIQDGVTGLLLNVDTALDEKDDLNLAETDSAFGKRNPDSLDENSGLSKEEYDLKLTRQLAERMKWLASNRHKAQQMGRNAYLYAKATFPSTNNSTKIYELYETLLRK